jgi:hypothetical protein
MFAAAISAGIMLAVGEKNLGLHLLVVAWVCLVGRRVEANK